MSYDPTSDPTAGHNAGHAGSGYPPPTDYPAGLGPRPAAPTTNAQAASTTARSNGLAIGGFVCAAVGAVAAFIPYLGILGFPVLVIGLVLSVIGLLRRRTLRGLAVAGLVVALVALPVDALITTATLTAASSTSTSDTTSGTTSGVTGPSAGDSGSGSTSEGTGGYSSGGYSSGGYSSGGYSGSSSGGSYSSGGYSSADLAYLATLSKYGVPVSSNAEAIEYGHGVCRYYAVGGSAYNLGQNLIDSGFTAYEAGVIIGAAEGAYCPS